jgi:hypothetical protein
MYYDILYKTCYIVIHERTRTCKLPTRRYNGGNAEKIAGRYGDILRVAVSFQAICEC